MQFLVTNLDYSDYVGRIAVGKIVSGHLKLRQEVALLKRRGDDRQGSSSARFIPMKGSTGWSRNLIEAGDIAAVAGVADVFIGDTLGDPDDPRPLPSITVEEPTLSMVFSVNTSPLAGKEGRLLTSRHIKERLDKELLYNVSIGVEAGGKPGFF